jgi:flagellar biosynthetic protein FliR
LLLVPILPPFPAVPLVSAQGAAMLIQQLLIGMSMGFVTRLIMAAVEMGGSLISTQMGLGFAMVFDPQNAGQTPALASILTMFVTLIFLALNGHQVILSTLVESFRVLPVGKSVPLVTWRMLAEWGGHIFSWGLWIALPVVAALLVANLAIGVMTRAAPQFNILSFGFPLTLSIGFVALYLSLPLMEPVLEQMYQGGFEFMLRMLKG